MEIKKVILFLCILFLGCKKKEVESYPDCFSSYESNGFYGCGNIRFLISTDDNSHIEVYLDEAALDLGTECKTFELNDILDKVNLRLLTYSHHPDSVYDYVCTDALSPNLEGQKTEWNLKSGELTVAVSRHRLIRNECEEYLASVKLANLMFSNSEIDSTFAEIVQKDIRVGYCIP